MNCNLYVIYSDEYNNEALFPAMLNVKELKEITSLEHELSHEEILKLSDIWSEIVEKNNDTDMRVMLDNKVQLISYSYFDDIILDKLKSFGIVKESKLVASLMSDWHLIDIIFVYLIDRLIDKGKIKIIKKNLNNNEFNNIISIS